MRSGPLTNDKLISLQKIIENGDFSGDDLKKGVSVALSKSTETRADLVSDLQAAGLVSPKDMQTGAFPAIKAIREFNDKSLAALKPFQELGERGVLQQKVFQGIATIDEVSKYKEQFGDDIQKSPLYEMRLEEMEKAIIRQQKASGFSQSGKGQKDFIDQGANRLTAEESQRQFDNSNKVVDRGLTTAQNVAQLNQGAGAQISNIHERTGQSLAGIIEREGSQLSSSFQEQAAVEAAVFERYGLTVTQLEQQFGKDFAANLSQQAQQVASVTTNFGQTRSGIQSTLGSNLVNSLTNQQNNIANFQGNASNQIAGAQNNLGANLANSTANQGQLTANAQEAAGTNRANLTSQAGTNVANIQTQLGSQKAAINEQTAANISSFLNSIATNKANTRTGSAATSANIGVTGQNAASQFALKAAELEALGKIAPWQGLFSGLQAGAGMFGTSKGLTG